jgi:phage terminase Nu1 subunit (DNA packaging protein)
VAQFTGVPQRTVYAWDRQGLITLDSDMSLTVKSIVSHLRKLADRKSQHTDDLVGQKTRLTEAQANKVELENRVKAGELVETAEIEKALGKAISAAKQKLLSIPSGCSAELARIDDPNKVNLLLTREIEQALNELCIYE